MRVPRERLQKGLERDRVERGAQGANELAGAQTDGPKQATDLRVDAWSSTGSLISGGTHSRHRVPCCWKWHSSTLPEFNAPASCQAVQCF